MLEAEGRNRLGASPSRLGVTAGTISWRGLSHVDSAPSLAIRCWCARTALSLSAAALGRSMDLDRGTHPFILGEDHVTQHPPAIIQIMQALGQASSPLSWHHNLLTTRAGEGPVESARPSLSAGPARSGIEVARRSAALAVNANAKPLIR